VRYKAFGVSRFTSGTTPTTFRYTGQREDAGLGLYYYGARWYDPALGHFIQPDTLIPDAGNALDYHRYGYTKFNPLKYTDPTGHCGMSESAGESWSGPYGEACMGFSAGLSAGNKAALSAGGGFGLLTALNTGLASGSPPSQADPLPPPLEAVAGELSGATSTSFPLADGGPQTSIPPSTGVFNNTLNLLTKPLPSQQAGSNLVASASDREYLARLPVRYGNRGPTTGTLVVDGKEYPVVSGRGGPAASMPNGSPGFNGLTKTHAEGHAAAIMHQIGALSGTLYINNSDGPCPGRTGCDAQLARMLPAGAKLRVVWGNMYEVHEKSYENETR
jgi:RHS repeat-associated protein